MKIISKPIDAIVVFKGAGKPLPYKFKYVRDDGENQEIRVGKIILVQEQRLAGIDTIVYDCQSEVDNYEKRYQLKYYKKECKWELYKI